jgi:hypothetical protein
MTMTRIKMSDFKAMYRDPSLDGLYHALLSVAKAEPGGEVMALDVDSLKGEAFRRQWNDWVRFNPTKVLDSTEQLKQAQREAEEATTKAINEAANKRLNALLHEEGLLEDDRNIELLKQWFERNPSAPYNVYNLNLAVEQLAAELTWAVWSPRRAQPVNEVLIEGTNEVQLPLDASESQMRRATKVQLQDLSKRRGEFRQSRKDSFGSAFIEPTF